MTKFHGPTVRLTLLGVLVLAASPASAGPLPRTHDGLFLRLQPGVSGAASQATTDDDMDLSLSGPGASFSWGVGHAVTPNLILGLDFSSSLVLGPTLKIDDEELEADEDVKWSVHYAGASATTYLGTTNLYLSGGLGALAMKLDAPGMSEAETEIGFGGRIAVGKEWWTSDNWGIGLGAELLVGAIPDDDATWSTAAFNIALSATYN
jgi:hypothetical protein